MISRNKTLKYLLFGKKSVCILPVSEVLRKFLFSCPISLSEFGVWPGVNKLCLNNCLEYIVEP